MYAGFIEFELVPLLANLRYNSRNLTLQQNGSLLTPLMSQEIQSNGSLSVSLELVDFSNGQQGPRISIRWIIFFRGSLNRSSTIKIHPNLSMSCNKNSNKLFIGKTEIK